MSQFPKYKYSENRETKLVQNAEEEALLGDKFFDTPREAGWLGEEERNKPKPAAPKPESEQLKELKEQNAFLFEENKRLQAALDESDQYIETLQKALEEAQKNDQRGADGKFKAADDGEGEAAEDEGEANDEAPAPEPAPVGPAPEEEPAPASEEGEAAEEAPAPKSKKKK